MGSSEDAAMAVLGAAARALAAAPPEGTARTLADGAARMASAVAVLCPGTDGDEIVASAGAAMDLQTARAAAASGASREGSPVALPMSAGGRALGHLVVLEPTHLAALEVLAAQGGLALAAADLASAERDAETRLAMLVHDLKQPITVLEGVVRTLEARGPDLASDDAAALLTTARRRSAEVADLIERLLQGTRRGDDVIEPAIALPVDALVEAATVGLGHLRPVEIGDLPERRVRVAPTAARVALQTLLDNAVRHSPAGSPVRLTVHQTGDDVIFEVRNATADKAAHRGSAGSGLGLSIAYRLAASLGGEVTYHGEGGQVIAGLRLPGA